MANPVPADPFEPSESVHTVVAVALRGGGLVVPALMDAQDLTLDETMSGMLDLVTLARDGDRGWRTLEAHPGNRRHNEMASKTPRDHASFLSKFADKRICI